jgi:hypothetical protein
MPTNYPSGVNSYGVPVLGANIFGSAWWVDGNLGSTFGPGDSRDQPYSTLAAVLALASSGDTIYVKGNITENIVAPAGLFNIKIVGVPDPPRHADAHTGNNGYFASTWKAATATEPLIKLRQQGWTIANFLLDCPTSDAAIEFLRDAASGDSERDSSHARILNCRFASGLTGILITGTENVFDVVVAGCVFNDLTNGIIGDTAWRWHIHDNLFMANTNHIDSGFTQAVIERNTFGKFTTKGIDLRGGADNVVMDNNLSGTYSEVGGYFASGASDEWGGNRNSLTGGITAADPA